MGSAGIFASGSGLLELKAAIVIDSEDAGRSRGRRWRSSPACCAAAVSRSRPASIPGPKPPSGVHVSGLPLRARHRRRPRLRRAGQVRARPRRSVGHGGPATHRAHSRTRPPTAAAATASGRHRSPASILQFPTLIGLLEGIGLTEDPPISKLVPYLRSLTHTLRRRAASSAAKSNASGSCSASAGG